MEETITPEIVMRLSGIRMRRLFLWLVFLTYLPAIGLALKFSDTGKPAFYLGITWLLMAAVGGVLVSFSRCPRCHELFHIQGYSTSWGRRCVNCNLHLNAGK
ncbi:MAG: hypothetical protein P8X63_10185 [Desulfuromonadaceae bacterium]